MTTDQKTVTVSLRVTEQERRRWQKAADNNQGSLSAWLRETANKETEQ